MNRNTNGAGLVRDRTRDGLTNPPSGIGRELVTAAIFKFINGLHQTDVAFLNQVKELQTAVGVFLGDRDHQSKVGFDHVTFSATGLGCALVQIFLKLFKLGVAHAGRF